MIGKRRIGFFLCIIFGPVGLINAQSFAKHQLAEAQTFIGSTPCDSLIRCLLEINPSTTCEFMKWELQLQRNKPNSFELIVFYGESKPNTNWFKNDGEKLALKGNYTVLTGSATNSKAKIYRLQAENLKSPILLIEMDPHIFHFADKSKNFIVGNAGFSYVLNRTTP